MDTVISDPTLLRKALNTLSAIFLTPSLFLSRILLLRPASFILYIVLSPPRFLFWTVSSILTLVYDFVVNYQTIIALTTSALLLGTLTGLVVYYTSLGLDTLLQISPACETPPQSKDPVPRTLQSWREARQLKKQQALLEEETKLAVIQGRIRDALDAKSPRSGHASWSQTILEEEEDSDF